MPDRGGIPAYHLRIQWLKGPFIILVGRPVKSHADAAPSQSVAGKDRLALHAFGAANSAMWVFIAQPERRGLGGEARLRAHRDAVALLDKQCRACSGLAQRGA